MNETWYLRDLPGLPCGPGTRRALSLEPGSAVPALTPIAPTLSLKALLTFGDNTDDGVLVEAVALPWFDLIAILQQDPKAIYEIPPRKWEEIIAGAYVREGFDEVILTPRSGDGGRDVVATKWGFGSIRFFDDVKAYGPEHRVSAKEVRAMLGVISGATNVSKGIITTTSDFAPRVRDDPFIKSFIPYRLELKPRDELLAWLRDLFGGKK